MKLFTPLFFTLLNTLDSQQYLRLLIPRPQLTQEHSSLGQTHLLPSQGTSDKPKGDAQETPETPEWMTVPQVASLARNGSQHSPKNCHQRASKPGEGERQNPQVTLEGEPQGRGTAWAAGERAGPTAPKNYTYDDLIFTRRTLAAEI